MLQVVYVYCTDPIQLAEQTHLDMFCKAASSDGLPVPLNFKKTIADVSALVLADIVSFTCSPSFICMSSKAYVCTIHACITLYICHVCTMSDTIQVSRPF